MTDTITPVSTPVVELATEVSTPISNAKPYDDELLDAYEAESSNEVEEAPTKGPDLSDKVINEKTSEKTEEESTKVEPEAPVGAKKGDKVDDGFEELPVTKIINGKEVEFKVKDAIQAYIKREEFNRDLDRRTSIIDRREKHLAKSQAEIKTNLSELIEVTRKGDFVNAVRGLAKIATSGTNLNVAEFEKQYFDQLESIRDVYTKLSPAEQKAYFAERAAEDAKEKLARFEAKENYRTQASQLEQQVTSLQQQHSVTEDEFWEHYGLMSQAFVGEGKQYATPNDIKPADVISKVLEARQYEKVYDAAEKLGLSDENQILELRKLVATSPELTSEDIAQIIKTSGILANAAPDVVGNLNRKVEKSKTRLPQASSAKKENDKIEGYDEETLNELYRYAPKHINRIRY